MEQSGQTPNSIRPSQEDTFGTVAAMAVMREKPIPQPEKFSHIESFAQAEQMEPGISDEIILELIRTVKRHNDLGFVSTCIDFHSLIPADKTDVAVTDEDSFVYKDKMKGLRTVLKGYAEEWAEQLGFLQASTIPLAEARQLGSRFVPTKRIYLNPQQLDRIEIFTSVMKNLSGNGIVAKAKLSDNVNNDPKHVRQDGVVVYVDDRQSDKALRIIEALYLKYEKSFSGRRSVPSTYEIAPGLALGEEPGGKLIGEESLTSYLTQVLERTFDVMEKQRKKQGLLELTEQQQLNWLRDGIPHALAKNHMNPKNWSFFKR